jgi:hypothetical protein
MTHEISIFISHSWSYSGHYDKLASWIFGEPWTVDGRLLDFTDLSIPEDNPVHDADSASELESAIYQRIVLSDVVVIPMGMYANHSKWIKKEVEGSQRYQVPILAVDPWGAERTSSIVKEAADHEVGWTQKSVIGGVWHLYRK